MSDIMLHLARPPPRQVRARPFVIQSMVQSAVLQSVPILTTMAPSPGAPPSGPAAQQAAPAAPPVPLPSELAAHLAAVNAAQSGHLAAHQAAVAAQQGPGATAGQTVTSQTTASTGAAPGPGLPAASTPVSLQQMLSSAMQQAGAGGGALQPVLVGIELGPDMHLGGPGGPQGLQGVLNSAIQQALNGAAGGAQGHAGGPQGGAPQVQVAMGAPMHFPMGPPPPHMGNLHSFDPFLPCSSHHVAGARGAARSGARPGRDVRSAPGSRSSSLPRTTGAPAASAGTTPSTAPQGWPFQPRAGAEVGGPPQGLGGLLAGMMGGQPIAGGQEADMNMINMIQGVMGQVVGVLGGGGAGGSPTTIAQFLNTLPDYSYVSGESLVTDLLMTLAEHLTFQDMVAIVGQAPSPATLAGLQAPLQQFLRQRVLQGGQASRPAVEASLLAVADDWYGQMEEVAGLATVREEVHFPETLHNFLASRPVELAMLVLEADRETFTASIGEAVRRVVAEATALCLHCFTDREVSLERVVENRLGALTEDVGPMIREWTLGSAISHLRSFVAGQMVKLLVVFPQKVGSAFNSIQYIVQCTVYNTVPALPN